jgi:hypothetical protein
MFGDWILPPKSRIVRLGLAHLDRRIAERELSASLSTKASLSRGLHLFDSTLLPFARAVAGSPISDAELGSPGQPQNCLGLIWSPECPLVRNGWAVESQDAILHDKIELRDGFRLDPGAISGFLTSSELIVQRAAIVASCKLCLHDVVEQMRLVPSNNPTIYSRFPRRMLAVLVHDAETGYADHLSAIWEDDGVHCPVLALTYSALPFGALEDCKRDALV